MFLLNSCLSLFSAARSRGHPFSRSYGVILPSSLTMLLPSALGFSPHPPVSVYGTGTHKAIAAFLGTWLTYFATFISLHVTSSDCRADLPTRLLPRLYRSFHSRLMLSTCVPTVLSMCGTGPGQISFTLETLDIRPEGFPPSSRYSFRHSLFLSLHRSFRYGFVGLKNAPLPISLC